MHKKLTFGLKFGLIGNLLFILFAIFAFWYYRIYDPDSKFCRFLELLTYATLIAGFVSLVISDVLMCISVRMKTVIKAAYTLYIIMEAAIMYCELNMYKVMEFYEPYSLKLAIVHAMLSAVVCFAFVYLDPYKTQFEVTVIICIGVILGGMFGNIMGIRVYFSVLVNAFAYTGLFAAMLKMSRLEIIEIDCYGDSARVAEYKSVIYEEEEEDTSPEKSDELEEKSGK